ncbi:FtsK/SpoIIIE domain-containing protein [Thalassobacillus hwangdonensis]|uniref:FtsK/SpoIIIE domain-containing protein n=1 Tax=Thalassobacillus hwangdonensis TaxID=546108 RepID=A0ABW3KYC3_9BACI
MWEIGAVTLAGMATVWFAGNPDSDKRKIKKVFANVRYGVKDYQPKLLRTIRKTTFAEYVYNVPYGLIDDPKLEPILTKTLDKPVHVYFDGKLHVRVYTSTLPTSVPYATIPKLAESWAAPIGITGEGYVYHDFDKRPHMSIAGMTRYGKSVMLKTIMTSLIEKNPEDVRIYIIDMKGGLEFGEYEALKQVVRVASNTEEAKECLDEVAAELRKDMIDFRRKGYNNVINSPIKKRTFVLVDEGAQLAPETHHNKKEKRKLASCHSALSEITRIGGALGYRLIFGTQYPTADTLPRQVKQNCDGAISFRLPTDTASQVAIDQNGAEKLAVPGRALYRTDKVVELQAPLIDDAEMWNRLKRYKVNKREVIRNGDNVNQARKTDTPRRGDYIEIG